MPRNSMPPDVPVLHDDDDPPPEVRRVTRRLGVMVSEVLRGRPQPAPPPRPRHDSIRPVGITIPPPAPSTSIFAVILSETRALTALMSRLNRTSAVFATAIVALLVVLVAKGRAAASADSASATAPTPPPTTATEEPRRQPAPPAAPPQEEPPARTAASAQTVEVGFSANVPTAQFRVDGGPWLANPSTHRVPKDDREHRIEARADGYFSRFASARFTEDILLEVTLERIGACACDGPVRPARHKEHAPTEAEHPDPATLSAAREERRAAASLDVFKGGQAPVRPIEQKSPYE